MHGNDPDYYEVLGVFPGASDDEIKAAYRKKAMQYHPDRNPGDAHAEEQFRLATEAYENLRDVQKRQVYDNQRGVSADGGNASGRSDLSYAEFGPEVAAILRRADRFTADQMRKMGIDQNATASQLRAQAEQARKEADEFERKKQELQAEIDRLNAKHNG